MAQKHNNIFYKKSIDKYGISALGVHWNSKYSQYKRFEIITKFIKKDIKSSTIVDVGCGFGEYYKYLELNHKLASKYIGVDCEKQMIDIAKLRFPNISFLEQNILDDNLIKADYYIASGALNILNQDEFYLFITNCFNASKKGFVFNFLISDSYNNITLDKVISFCKTLTSNVEIETEYLDNDCTIYLR